MFLGMCTNAGLSLVYIFEIISLKVNSHYILLLIAGTVPSLEKTCICMFFQERVALSGCRRPWFGLSPKRVQNPIAFLDCFVGFSGDFIAVSVLSLTFKKQ